MNRMEWKRSAEVHAKTSIACWVAVHGTHRGPSSFQIIAPGGAALSLAKKRKNRPPSTHNI